MGDSANAVPRYQKLRTRVTHIWGNRKGQQDRSAMASLALGEPPSWSRCPLCQVSMNFLLAVSARPKLSEHIQLDVSGKSSQTEIFSANPWFTQNACKYRSQLFYRQLCSIKWENCVEKLSIDPVIIECLNLINSRELAGKLNLGRCWHSSWTTIIITNLQTRFRYTHEFRWWVRCWWEKNKYSNV